MTSRSDRLRTYREASRRARFPRQVFERLVEEALAELPERFARRLSNVAVVIEDRPTREKLAGLGHDPDDGLLGLYEGTPLGDRGSGYHLAVPDRITIYRLPILEMCRTEDEIVHEIRSTVIHEIGHYFGLNDDDME